MSEIKGKGRPEGGARAAIVIASSLASLPLSLSVSLQRALTRFSARRDSARAAWRSMLKKRAS